MQSADLGPVLNALSDLLGAFDMTTTDTGNGDRRVDSPAHACTLSEATDRAVQAMGALWRALPFEPVPAASVPPFIQLSSSDSPTAPGQPEAVGEVSVLRLGEGGTVPMVVAAYETVTSVLGFPARRWNAMQARRPGANHKRWLALDVIPRQHLAELRKAAALLHQVERTLLAREASGTSTVGIDLPPLREIEAMAKEAAARWASIEAIADLLYERVRAAWAFIAKHPLADRDLAVGADVDLEVDENGADVTGRTLSWSAGPGYTRFRGVLMQLYPIAHAEVLRYLESRNASDKSYRPACDGAALIDALRYLNDPLRVEQAWADTLRGDARLRQYISSELESRSEDAQEHPDPAVLPTIDLTPGERAVHERLKGRCMNADALARAMDTSPQTVRGHVSAIRLKRPGAIQTKNGWGYFRPDSPPDWDNVPVPRKPRRIRTA